MDEELISPFDWNGEAGGVDPYDEVFRKFAHAYHQSCDK